ncbi:lysine N(6)-hydroxylase/L-ornithine N(5)-oxygenase family protein [Bacillus sp. H-16]|uniref:lysine N(6)-hydroxylase/L-ornithine N(5)-oxygenase family protein n=1 Tax=Alteribacter salitolerans TaxID=2912333 RepID=UPI00196443EB|nr:lysine N(6)-hydroxylase/L-ornithine N(5)-oxygenase family protein [Alteribacter salitolerans]MBM7095911.1 lysine N(6)-hydroxylase/L-ornithine N(5)-oxygenase family protein [Alteribacter salitolerans]
MSLINEQQPVFDVIGVGVGPFNLGMAALLEPIEDINALFLEKKPEFQWHPDMLIEGTTLQVPFLADLVSMVDVQSPYSFLAYLQAHNRLYHFYFFEKFHIPRKEYNQYCRWVSKKLNACRFGMNVQKVTQVEGKNERQTIYEVTVLNEQTLSVETFLTKQLVIGIGSVPAVPKTFKPYLGESVFHTSQYLSYKEQCQEGGKVAIIGSGQSAAEVFLDLARAQSGPDVSLHWYTRSKGFFPMEYSKLGLEYFSPDYTDFFYELSQSKKDKLLKEQDLLYKGISADTIADIYDHLYERSVTSDSSDIQLQAMTEIIGIEKKGENFRLSGCHHVSESYFEVDVDRVILGTGYKPKIPDFLEEMHNWIAWDDQGRYRVKKDYRLETFLETENHIFVQNGEFHTHGVGAPDLGLGAHRNAVIINQIAGKEVYSVQSKNVFQTFGLHEHAKRPLTPVSATNNKIEKKAGIK